MIETELKVRISAEEARIARERLSELCRSAPNAIDKRDTYFHLPTHLTNEQPRHIRLRRFGNGACVCTVKMHTINSDGVERNKEAEFTVESYEKASAALQLFGFVIDIEKHKTGYAYRYQSLLVEVVKVVGLAGQFIEIEHLSQEAAPPSLHSSDQNSAALWDMLAMLDISPSRVEQTRYIDLLRANKKMS